MQSTGLRVLVKAARDSGDEQYGADARFLKITEDVGLKYFATRKMRDRNYERQSLLADCGLAPSIGGKVEFRFKRWRKYGFMTEVVETIQSRYGCGLYGLSTETKNEIDADIEDLWCRSLDVGLDVADLHYGNIGWNKSGDMVILDVSRFTDSDGFNYE